MRKFLVTMAVLLVVVGGGLVAMDFGAAAYAESQIAAQVSTEVDNRGLTSQPPSVAVGGFPFLTQVVSGRYDEITIELRDLSNGSVTLPKMTIVASGVDAPLTTVRSGDGPIVADRVTGESTVPWRTIIDAIDADGLNLSADDAGQIKISGAVGVAGITAEVTGTGSVSITNGRVRLSVTSLSTANPIANAQIKTLLDRYRSLLTHEVTLPRLPYNLKVNEVRATPAGIRVGGLAETVTLSQ